MIGENEMEDGLTGQLILILVLIICSGYFSATETAFTSVNRIRMKNLAGDGDPKAEKDSLRFSDP